MNQLITTTELLLVQSALPDILGPPVHTLLVVVSICGSPLVSLCVQLQLQHSPESNRLHGSLASFDSSES
jgi:hypothetical protein